MKYVYGPVNSRRLGLSLGVSLAPYKICNFNCIYCQLGKTNTLTTERKEYVKLEDVLGELNIWLKSNTEVVKDLNFITLSGLGEPTLNSRIGETIKEIKKITNVPVAVITNASLLDQVNLRASLLQADLIVPSLDSVIPEVFSKIDRPHRHVKLENIISGLISLRKEFRGKISLEIMLVRGVNDDLRHIKKLNEVIEQINPNKIHLNSPVRTTSEPNVLAVDKSKLKKIKEIMGDKCEIL